MLKNIFFLFFSIVIEFSFAQKQNALYSVDYNTGYNLSRVESNYFFEENMPFSLQFNWQKSNFYSQKDLNRYGYTDFGVTFLLHHYNDNELGTNYGILAFMEFYLIKPIHKMSLSFRLSQGISYNTNPYDKQKNPKNYFFGTHLSMPINLFFYWRYPKIIDNFGAEIGLGIFHYSNGNLGSPNYGSNIPSINFGINYDLRKKVPHLKKQDFSFDKKWHSYGFIRFGINESDYVNSGKFPFFVPGFQLEKHINFRHKFSLGTEWFLSYFLKEQIAYEAEAYPEYNVDAATDFKRVGVYGSYEFYYKKFGLDFGLGYYIYYPYAFETRYYNRMMFKYYLKNNIILGGSLKFHALSRAEAFEFFVGYRIL